MVVRSTRSILLEALGRSTPLSGRRGFVKTAKRRAVPGLNSQESTPSPPPPPPQLQSTHAHNGDDNSSPLPASLQVRSRLNLLERLFSEASPLHLPVAKGRIRTAEELLSQTSSTAGARRPLRIGVVGARSAGAADLATALLDEPLIESADLLRKKDDPVDSVEAVGRRYERRADLHPKQLRIFYDDNLGASSDQHDFAVPHPWLRDQEIEILELFDPQFDNDTIGALYACDSLFFVSDAAFLSARSLFAGDISPDPTLQLLNYFADKAGTRLVINHAPGFAKAAASMRDDLIDRRTLDLLEAQVQRGSNQPESAVLNVCLDEAIAANEALRQALVSKPATSSDSAATAWEDFATLYNASNVRQLKGMMEQMPLAGADKGQSDSRREAIMLQTAAFVAQHAIDEASSAIGTIGEMSKRARGAARVLEDSITSQRDSWLRSLFLLPSSEGRSETSESRIHQRAGDRSKRVEGSVRDSRGVVEKTFATRLAWWRIWWRVDDVRAETEWAISKSFAKDLESQLRFEAGKLLYYTKRLNDEVDVLIASLRQDSKDGTSEQQLIITPTLLNAMRVDSTEEVASRLYVDILCRPIEERRKLLLAPGGPVDLLSARAQRAALTSTTLVGGAGFTSVVGTIASSPWSSTLPSTLAQHMAMVPSTAGGLFAFAAVASAWILQSRWARAKRRFWRDWESVANGLDDDLRSNFQETFQRTAAAQSHTAARELLRVASEREEALRRIDELWKRVKTF